jgi:hypothetical protein
VIGLRETDPDDGQPRERLLYRGSVLENRARDAPGEPQILAQTDPVVAHEIADLERHLSEVLERSFEIAATLCKRRHHRREIRVERPQRVGPRRQRSEQVV